MGDERKKKEITNYIMNYVHITYIHLQTNTNHEHPKMYANLWE